MAGRPKNPTAWASGNYPAGANAWNNTVKRVANAGRYFEPKQLASPQEMNDAIGELIDGDATIINAFGQGPALNWRTQDTTGHGLQHVLGMTYDQRYGRWVTFGYSTNTNAQTVAMSVDGGFSWSLQGGQNASSGTINNALRGLIYRPDTGRCAVATFPGAQDSAAVVDEETRLTLNDNIGTTTKLTGIWFNNLYIFAGYDNGGSLVKTCPGGGVTTWTTRTATPVNWNLCQTFFADTSGSKVMVVGGDGNGVGVGILSSDGVTWSNVAIASTAGWFVKGFCWAADRWVVVESNGTDSKIYTSINDGVTWSLVSTLTGVVVSGMNSVGSLLFISTRAHTILLGAYSTDGGVTWRNGCYYTYTPAVGGTPDQYVVSSGTAFGAFNLANKVNISNHMGQPGTPFP